MEEPRLRFLVQRIEKILDALAVKPNDITEIVVRFDGKKITQVDLNRNLSRFS